MDSNFIILRSTKVALMTISVIPLVFAPTITAGQDDRIRLEASGASGRYEDVTWSALSCYSAPCATNQHLETTGNGKPYWLQIDQCDSTVELSVGNGELIGKGVKVINFRDCNLFFAERNSSVGREILHTCPIGSRCHIETSIQGDSGIPFVVNIERIK